MASTVLDELLDWAYSQAVGFLGAFFALMGNMGVELFDLPWVQAVVRFFSQLGWALFGVSLVVACFEFGIEYSSGRGNIRHTAINCLKGFLAVSLFSTVPVRLYALSVSLQASFTAGITGLGTGIGEIGQNIITKLTTPEGLIASGVDFIFNGPSFNPIMMLFCVILMAYAVLKVFFANLKRGGILLIQIAVGALYMFSVPRGYSDGFICPGTWAPPVPTLPGRKRSRRSCGRWPSDPSALPASCWAASWIRAVWNICLGWSMTRKPCGAPGSSNGSRWNIRSGRDGPRCASSAWAADGRRSPIR